MDNREESKSAFLGSDDRAREPTKLYTIDTLFKDLGHCGRFQVILFTLGYLPIIHVSCSLIFMMFGNYNPGWKCLDKPHLNTTEFLEYSCNNRVSTAQDGRILSGNKTSVSSCDVLRLCENVTFSNLASTIITEWSLICDNSWIPSIIVSIQMIGVMAGSFTGGQVGDRFGRKFSIHGSAALLALINVISIFSVSWQMYAVMRFLIGFFSGNIVASVVVYTFEFITGWWRSVLGTFPFWNVTYFTFGLCVMALKDWKHIHIATALASVIAFLPVFWLPESLRFLTVHGQLQRGNQVVRKIAKVNRKPIPDTTIMSIVAETEKGNLKQRTSYTFLNLFSRNIRKPTIVMGLTWCIISMGFYMIGLGIKALSGDFYINFLLFTSLSIPARCLSVVLSTKFGRKASCAFCIFISSVCPFSVVAIQLLAPEEGKVTPTIVMALGSNMMMESAWGAALVLVIELSPTSVRNLSFGFCNGWARIGAILSPYLVANDTLPLFGSFLVLGILQIICFAAILTLPESKGKPLQDNLVTTTKT